MYGNTSHGGSMVSTRTDVFEYDEGGEHGDLELHGVGAPQQL